MKKILILFVILTLGLTSCGKKDSAESAKTDKVETAGSAATDADGFYAPDGTVHELTNASLYTPGVKVPNLTVLDFNAVWCPPCRALNPVLHQMAEKYSGRVTFVSIDVDSYGPLFMAWQVGESIPAVVFIKPDGSTSYTVGTGDLMPAEKFASMLDGLLQ